MQPDLPVTWCIVCSGSMGMRALWVARYRNPVHCSLSVNPAWEQCCVWYALVIAINGVAILVEAGPTHSRHESMAGY